MSVPREGESKAEEAERLRRWQEERIERKLRAEYQSYVKSLNELVSSHVFCLLHHKKCIHSRAHQSPLNAQYLLVTSDPRQYRFLCPNHDCSNRWYPKYSCLLPSLYCQPAPPHPTASRRSPLFVRNTHLGSAHHSTHHIRAHFHWNICFCLTYTRTIHLTVCCTVRLRAQNPSKGEREVVFEDVDGCGE